MSDSIIYVAGGPYVTKINSNNTVETVKISQYQSESGSMRSYPMIGQGPATRATAEDEARDALGFTHPNLHRRVFPQSESTVGEYEYVGRTYQLMIQGNNSYRTTTMYVHDENSTESEIP